MKTFNPHYTSTTDDILTCVKNWKDNPYRTANQLKFWPEESIIEQLGCDANSCLRLLKADGYDDEPVIRFIKNEEIFECITNRRLLPVVYDDVMRVAHFFHLGELHALIMLVKLRWETFLIKENVTIQDAEKVEELVNSFLTNEEEVKLLENTSKTLDSYFNFSSLTGYSGELFNNLLRHIILTRIFFHSVLSKETEAFINSQKELIALFKVENEEFNEIFHALNKQWMRQVQAAELLHLKLEDRRYENAKIEKKWLAEFGALYCELLRTETECKSLERQIKLKQTQPTITIEQLVEAEQEMVQAEQQQLLEMERELAVNWVFSLGENAKTGSAPISDELIKTYKKALRTIWLKTHPDKVADKSFSPEQLEELNKFYKQATELNSSDRLLNPLTINKLNEIIEEIDLLYTNMGINIPTNSIILGNTLKEKAEWLDKQIKRLDGEISLINNEIFSLASNPVIKQKAESLTPAENAELVKKQLSEKRQSLVIELEKLKEQLNKLFN